MKKRFDYRRYEAGRRRLGNLTFGLIAAWWAALLFVGLGSSWSEPLARLKDTAVWGGLTIDRLLATGGAVTVAIAIAGPWLLRNLRRPPELFVVLRDFRSRAAAELATDYVRRHGARWGYWLTLENADLRAADSVGGEVETEPEDEAHRNQKPPVGSWWGLSLVVGLVLTTLLLLGKLDSAVLEWMRAAADRFGTIGDLAFGIVSIVGICAAWLAATVIIRWLLLTVQRAVVLPGTIASAETGQRVLDTIFSRVRRRATTLTLGPMPIVAVDDAWWQTVVERCVAEARLVVFLLAERESAHLDWEIDHVRRRFDPRRTLIIELAGDGLRLRDGTGQPRSGTPFAPDALRIDAAVRAMLLGDDA